MKYALSMAMAAFLVVGVAFAQDAAYAAAPDLPAEVLAVVEIRNLDKLEQHLQAFLSAVKPGTPLPPVAAAFTQWTKLADPSVLDSALPQRLLVVKTAAGGPAVVAVLRATDAQAYMDGLLPTLTKTEVEGDITLFVEEKSVFDKDAYQQATPEEQRDGWRFFKSLEVPVAIGVKEKFVCVGKNKASVATALELVGSGKLAAEPILAGGDLAAHVRLQDLLDALTTPAGGPFDVLREGAMEMMSGGDPDPLSRQMAMTRAMLNAEIDALESLLNQIESAHARLSADGEELRLSVGLDAVAGSTLAGYFASVPTGRPDTLAYLPQDAFVVAALKLGSMDALTSWAVDFQAKIMAAQGAEPGAETDFVTAMQNILPAYGDEFSAAMRPGKGMQMVEVIRMKDAEAVKKMSDEMQNMADLTTQMYKDMGLGMKMEFNPAALTHNGHEISEWRMSFDVQTPEDADPMTGWIYAQQQRAMKAMFGDALMICSVGLDSDWLLTIGKDSLKSLKAILDGTYAKLIDDPTFQQSLARIPADSEGVMYVHLTGLFKWIMSFVQTMSGGLMPPMFADLQFERGPGIVAGINVSDMHVVCDIIVPAAEIKSLVDGFERGMAGPLQRARGEARTAACKEHLSQIGKAIFAYTMDHDELLPETLQGLMPAEYVASDEVFHCPSADKPGISYAYVGGEPKQVMPLLPSDVIVAYDFKGNHEDGRNVLYCDGHVSWSDEARFQERLKESGRTVRRMCEERGLTVPEHVENFYADKLNP